MYVIVKQVIDRDAATRKQFKLLLFEKKMRDIVPLILSFLDGLYFCNQLLLAAHKRNYGAVVEACEILLSWGVFVEDDDFLLACYNFFYFLSIELAIVVWVLILDCLFFCLNP